LLRDQEAIEHLVGALDVPLAVLQGQRQMAGKQRRDRKLPEFPQRIDQSIKPAIVNVLKKNLAAKKDDVTGEQHRLSAIFQEQGNVTVRMARRVEDRQSKTADLNGCSFLELVIHRAWLKVVVERIDTRLLGHVHADRLLVALAQTVGDRSRGIYGRLAEQVPHPGGPTGMVAVPMRKYQVPDSGRIESVAFYVLNDSSSPHSGAYIDQCELASTIDQIDVAVIWIGEVETVAARSDQVDSLGQSHGIRKLKL
jgi:hypothetical protein